MLISAAAGIILVLHIQRFQGLLGVREFSVLVLLLVGYSTADALVVLSPTLAEKQFWLMVRSVCVIIVPPMIILVVSRLTDNQKLTNGVSQLTLAIIPSITLVLLFIQSPLLSYNARLEPPSPFIIVDTGPWIGVFLLYSFAINLWALQLLIRSGRYLPKMMVYQRLLGSIAIVFPLLIDCLYRLRIFPEVPGLIPLSMSLSVTWGALGLAISRLRLFNVTPIARSKVFETMQDGFLVADHSDKLTDFNPAAVAVMGILTEQATVLLKAETVTSLFTGYPAVLALFQTECGQTEISAHFGKKRYDFEVSMTSLFDPQGQALGKLTTLRDITTRKQAERALAEREERFSLIVESIPFPLVLTRLKSGEILYVNQEGAQLVGVPQAEIIGRRADEFCVDPTELIPLTEDIRAKSISRGREIAFKRADGTPFNTVVAAVATVFRGERVMLTGISDITARKREERLLQEREEQFRVMVEYIPFPIVMTRISDNRVIYLNRACAELTAISQADAVGMPSPNFYADPADRDRVVRELQRSGVLTDYEVKLRKHNGETIDALISIISTDFRGERVFLAGINDITLRKESEPKAFELAMEKQKLEILNEFIANASHDLRTPLAIITTATYMSGMLLQRVPRLIDQLVESDLASEQRESHASEARELIEKVRLKAATVEKSAFRIAQIVEGMIEIIRLENSHPYVFMPTNLNLLISNLMAMIRSLATMKELNVQFKGVPNLPLVALDAPLFTRAVQCLLDNAISYTPTSGTIVVKTQVSGEHLQLSVEDTGIGIADSDMPLVFRPFYRVDQARSSTTGGVGLGLAVAKRIVNAHYGEITVTSQLGVGSTFTISLPIGPVPIG